MRPSAPAVDSRTAAGPEASGAPLGGRHGDIFPLPQVWPEEALHNPGLPRGCRQRIGRRLARARAARRAVESLNMLAAGGGKAHHHSFVGAHGSPAQRNVLEGVRQAVAPSPPCGAELEPEAALRALLRAGSDYCSGPAGGLASFKAGSVSLPADQRVAAPLTEVLTGEALADVEDFENRMLLGDEELAAVAEKGWARTYCDPAFRSRKKYLQFISELYSNGLIVFWTP